MINNNLPSRTNTFIGREYETARIKQIMTSSFNGNRMLTLVGPQGSGKTTLALKVAAELLPTFQQGIWLVELIGISDPAQVFELVASVLGVSDQSDRPLLAAVVDYLRFKRLLLVLDNCDNVSEACVQLANTLLADCPSLRILATSRQPLQSQHETVLAVPVLSLPGQVAGVHTASANPENLYKYEAVHLLLDKIQAVRPDFKLTRQNAAQIVHVSQQLGGLPLAIELAASSFCKLSIGQIEADLETKVLPLETEAAASESKILPLPSLESLFNWTWDLLSTDEQILLRRLTVFVGNWQVEAAQAICVDSELSANQIPPLLPVLVSKSLLVTDDRGCENNRISSDNSAAKSNCYRMPDTIYEFVLKKLGGSESQNEMEAVKHRHLVWFLKIAEEADPFLLGPTQHATLVHLDAKRFNFQAALQYAFASDAPISEATNSTVAEGMRLAAAISNFWHIKGYWSEGLNWLKAALARIASVDSDGTLSQSLPYARILFRAGTLTRNYDEGRVFLEESLHSFQQLGDKVGTALVLQGLGQIALFLGDRAIAQHFYERSLALFRELDNKPGIAGILNGLALLALLRDEYANAMVLFEENLAFNRELGERANTATSLHHLGELASYMGKYQEAWRFLEESLSLFQDLEDSRAIGWSMNGLAEIAYAEGKYDAAHSYFKEGMAVYQSLEDDWGIAYARTGLGKVARQQREYRRSRQLLEEALTIYKNLQNKDGVAQAKTHLGLLAIAMIDYPAADELLHESLQVWYELNSARNIALCLEGLASVGVMAATVQTRPARIARLLGAAAAIREKIGAPVPTCDLPLYQRTLERSQSLFNSYEGSVEMAFAAAWSEGQAMGRDQVVEYALSVAELQIAE